MDVVKDGAARRGWLPKDWAIGLKQCVGLAPGRPRFALARSEGRAQAAAAKKQEAAANATKRITEQDVESRRHRGLLLRSCVMVQTLRRLRPGAQGFGKELSASSQGHVFLSPVVPEDVLSMLLVFLPCACRVLAMYFSRAAAGTCWKTYVLVMFLPCSCHALAMMLCLLLLLLLLLLSSSLSLLLLLSY
jgi:hypothetical protein